MTIAPIVATPSSNPVLSQKDMLTHCLQFLPLRDIPAAGSVSKEWHERLKNVTPAIINSELQRFQDILIKKFLLLNNQRVHVKNTKSTNFSKLLDDKWNELAEVVLQKAQPLLYPYIGNHIGNSVSDCGEMVREILKQENLPQTDKFAVRLQIAEISKEHSNNQDMVHKRLILLCSDYLSTHKRLDLALFVANRLPTLESRDFFYLQIGIYSFITNNTKVALEMNAKVSPTCNSKEIGEFAYELAIRGYISEAIENVKKNSTTCEQIVKKLVELNKFDDAVEIMSTFPNIYYNEINLGQITRHYILNGNPKKAIALLEKLKCKLGPALIGTCVYPLWKRSDLYSILSAIPSGALRDQLCINSITSSLEKSEAIKIILLIENSSEKDIAVRNYEITMLELFEVGLARDGHINEAITRLKKKPRNHCHDDILKVLLNLRNDFEDAEKMVSSFPNKDDYHPILLAKLLSHYILKGQARRSIDLIEKMQLKLSNEQHLLKLCAENCAQDPDINQILSKIPNGDLKDQLCLLISKKPPPLIVKQETPPVQVPKPQLKIELSRVQLGKNLVANFWKNAWYRVLSCLTVGLLPLFTFLFGLIFQRANR